MRSSVGGIGAIEPATVSGRHRRSVARPTGRPRRGRADGPAPVLREPIGGKVERHLWVAIGIEMMNMTSSTSIRSMSGGRVDRRNRFGGAATSIGRKWWILLSCLCSACLTKRYIITAIQSGGNDDDPWLRFQREGHDRAQALRFLSQIGSGSAKGCRRSRNSQLRSSSGMSVKVSRPWVRPSSQERRRRR